MINYENIKQLQLSQLQLMQKRSVSYSVMRISAMIFVLLFLWLGHKSNIFYAISVLFLILFLCLVHFHEQLKDAMLMKQTKVEVIDKLKCRESDAWKQESLESSVDETSLLNDLDICGKTSLLNYIQMAETPYGKETLYSYFQTTATKEDIMKRQRCVKALLEHPDELLNLQTYSALFYKHSKKIKRGIFQQLVEHAGIPMKESALFYQFTILMVCVTIGLLLGCFLFSSLVDAVWIMISLNIIIVLFNLPKNSKYLIEVSAVKDILEDYLLLMKEIDSLQIQNKDLQGMKAVNKKGLQGIHALLAISHMTRLRSNFITNLLFNGLFQLDFYCIHRLAKWKQSYGTHMQEWLQVIAEIESYTSLCVLGQVKQSYCFPVITDKEKPEVSFAELYHPLIAENHAVANSLRMQNGTYIITGSNMSGKTTFLRTIGINAMLAMAGGPVCGNDFSMNMMSIYTSMRVKDDVSEGISTFYAELLSVKQMMDATKSKLPMLVLIDEIFKGTNSADRIICAKEAIRRLHLPWSITMVSTHDFELCSLESDSSIQAQNYHFEEFYIGDEIHFDYLLKKGKCTTTNAKQLMKMAGF